MSIDSNVKKLNSINSNDVEFTPKKIIIILALVTITSFLFRVYYFPFDLPFTNDSTGYFWYANDMAILGNFPSEIASKTVSNQFPNNGWPAFLSIFFSILDSNEFIHYVNLQRFIGIIISTITIIPLYFLISKFLKKNIAILASSVFAFSPRLVENSLLGNTEAPFLLLIITSLSLFLSNKYKLVVISFAIAGLSALVRYEGLLIIIPLTIMFFFRFKKKNNLIVKYVILLSVFVLILLPMSYVRMETTGQDGLISHVSSGPQYYNSVIDSNPEENILLDFISKGFTFLIKYAAILTIPMFIIFLPLGIFKFFKNRDEKKWTIIIFSLILLIPAFYAYSRGFQEMKYLFILYPIFCICIGFTFTEIEKKINRKNLFFIIFLIGIISSSLLFTNLMILDFNHEKEIFDISKDLAKEMSFVNRDYEGLSYFAWVKKDLENNFPILSTELAKTSEIKIVMIGKNTSHDFDNLDEYLKYGKTQGMNHLVLDGSNLDNEMLVHIFENEEQYPFLEKIYDSSEKNYSYHVKAYKINYSEFESTNKNE